MKREREFFSPTERDALRNLETNQRDPEVSLAADLETDNLTRYKAGPGRYVFEPEKPHDGLRAARLEIKAYKDSFHRRQKEGRRKNG